MNPEQLQKLRELAEKPAHDGKDAAEALLALPVLLSRLDQERKERAKLRENAMESLAVIGECSTKWQQKADEAEARASRAEQATQEAEAKLALTGGL